MAPRRGFPFPAGGLSFVASCGILVSLHFFAKKDEI